MLSGVVLAGGSGTRMGQEKGLVRLGDEPLAARVVKILDDVADEVVVAVAKGKISLYRELLGPEVIIVEDQREGVGPLEGLVRAFEITRGEYALVSPCDTPFLRTAVCREIIERAKGRDGAVPRVGGFLEPLHGAYSKGTCLEAFRTAIERGKHKPVDAYPGLDLAFVDERSLRELDPNLESFWNLNSPEDLEGAKERLRAGPSGE
jgi:molybdopterin-guanine dinucleotide biosynthesis protein A